MCLPRMRGSALTMSSMAVPSVTMANMRMATGVGVRARVMRAVATEAAQRHCYKTDSTKS